MPLSGFHIVRDDGTVVPTTEATDAEWTEFVVLRH
jgi:hypothetical protein